MFGLRVGYKRRDAVMIIRATFMDRVKAAQIVRAVRNQMSCPDASAYLGIPVTYVTTAEKMTKLAGQGDAEERYHCPGWAIQKILQKKKFAQPPRAVCENPFK